MVHSPGTQHRNVDALSRVPCNQCGRDNHEYSTDSPPAQIGIVSKSHSTVDVRDQQLNDPSIVPVLKSKEVGVVPHYYELNTWSRESRQLIQMWSS